MIKPPANLPRRFLAGQIYGWLFLLPNTFFLSLLAKSLTISQLLGSLFVYMITVFPLLVWSFLYKGSVGNLLKENRQLLALVVLALAIIANLLFITSAVNAFFQGPLPLEFEDFYYLRGEQQKEQLNINKLQESFLSQDYPPNTHIGLIEQNN